MLGRLMAAAGLVIVVISASLQQSIPFRLRFAFEQLSFTAAFTLIGVSALVSRRMGLKHGASRPVSNESARRLRNLSGYVFFAALLLILYSFGAFGPSWSFERPNLVVILAGGGLFVVAACCQVSGWLRR